MVVRQPVKGDVEIGPASQSPLAQKFEASEQKTPHTAVQIPLVRGFTQIDDV